MIVQDRDTSRKVFVDTWMKYRRGERLGSLEQIVLSVILQHTEYQRWLDDKEIYTRDFTTMTNIDNPFLHMGMHIAINEQTGADRPPGIRSCYQNLLGKYTDEHKLQHTMMECLGQCLWQAQTNRTLPDEMAYLESLRKLV